MGDVGGRAIDGVVGGEGEAVTSGGAEVDGVGGEVILKRERERAEGVLCYAGSP